MNRKQLRDFAKQVKQYNKKARQVGKPEVSFTQAYGSAIINPLNNGAADDRDNAFLRQTPYAHMDNMILVPDGTKCKLNIEAISSRPDINTTDGFKTWIDAHKDAVMLVTRDGASQSLVCLTNLDGNKDNEFLFDIYSDLLIYDEDSNNYLPLSEIESNKEAKEDQKIESAEINNQSASTTVLPNVEE